MPRGRAAPARVEQRDPAPGRGEVDRNAVGDGDGEQRRRGAVGDPAVHAFDLQPASAARRHGLDRDAVHLIAEHDGVEAGLRLARNARQRLITSPTGASLQRPRSNPRPGSRRGR